MRTITVLIFFVIKTSLAVDLNWKADGDYEGVKIYTSENYAKNGLLPFKGVLEYNLPAEKVVIAVMDPSKKHFWAEKLKSVQMHKIIRPGHFLYSEFYRAPWPLTDRQFLVEGKVWREGKKTIFKGVSVDNKKYFNKDHIVAHMKALQLEVIPVSENRTRLELSFICDPKGYIPNWVVNMVQRKWPATFLQQLVKYASSSPKNTKSKLYTEWLANPTKGPSKKIAGEVKDPRQ